MWSIRRARKTFKLNFIYCTASLDGCVCFFFLPAKILVHCAVGVSRSASLVLAYLMINHHLPLVEAIKTVKEHRWISPNRGFLKHLRNLDVQLRQRKDRWTGNPINIHFTEFHPSEPLCIYNFPWSVHITKMKKMMHQNKRPTAL